jgi:hypothetical protein
MGATSFVKLGVANTIDANVAIAASSRILPPFSPALSQSTPYSGRNRTQVFYMILSHLNLDSRAASDKYVHGNGGRKQLQGAGSR